MDRTPQRRERLARTLEADGVDALLVASVTNVRYLTGFTGEDSMLLVTGAGDRAVILSDGRFTTQIEEECAGLDVQIRQVGQPMSDVIADCVARLGLRRLALEASVVTVADFEELKQKLPEVALVPVKDRVEALRIVKDEVEVAAIREAVDIAEHAFARLRAELRTWGTEKDAADALEGYMKRLGATAASFPTIVAVGAHAALPHARPTDTPLDRDDFVLVDWGASCRPYKSDLTRVLVTGKVSAKFEAVYRTVLAAQERAIAAIRPGVAARDVDAVARSVIEEAGYGACFQHGLGHGLGMDCHEAPRLNQQSEVTLQPGMVVTVEPGIYLPGWGGVRIEDDVLVTPGGAEVLTHVPKSLDSVRVP